MTQTITSHDEELGLGKMLPAPDRITPWHESARLAAGPRPSTQWRPSLRRIPNARNAIAVAGVFVELTIVLWAATALNNPVVWVVAFLWMGRVFARFASLMHEAAHRLLFSNRPLNDFVGCWLLGYPSFTPTDSYRRAHMAHHRQEFGPNEPDIALYRAYPISRASMARKLLRDAAGITGLKLMFGLVRGLRSSNLTVVRQAWSIIITQGVVFATFLLWGHPWLYLFLWVAPFLTVWRVINRLRSIAEHGGLHASPEKRETTHSVRQHALARLILVPHHIGWHLAHHVDPGIPHSRLATLHKELEQVGYVTDMLEFSSYLALWRRLTIGPLPALDSQAEAERS